MALLQILLVVVLATLAAGCAVAAGIFKAGFWIGLIIAICARRRPADAVSPAAVIVGFSVCAAGALGA